ncbi:metal-dependent transcriptional regulator [Thermoflexibacter ruber]|uniref:Transcriptional regulator MntR n=1 Tax=Thermoflexibacter ruber TaxID=1003 RepID=A0A1I2IB44_9BACT|nr:metal-dependent transcriptional regulator [Thermoflexibacter ruber]SFF39515.1 iron (metal) dependent repressor, DtxR family [Thermoflexibacter ruber]
MEEITLNKNQYSLAEEDYIKAIYHLSQQNQEALTNDIAERLETKPASVSDMLKKLADKKVVNYVKYKGVTLTEEGVKIALELVRKHRLWEVFLVEKLNFTWDEVHEVAEQLEHINSPLLIERLDEFLGFPKFDPHGDPIPDAKGEFLVKPHVPLGEMEIGQVGRVVAVQDISALFLQYLNKVGIYIGAKVSITDKIEYDGSLEVLLDDKKTILVSKEVAKNIFVGI